MPVLDSKPARTILLCLALFGTTASAAPPQRRVVVDRFEGRGSAIPRAGAIQALEAEKSLKLLSVRLLEQNKRLLDGTQDGYRKLGERLDVIAILRANVKAVDGSFRASITVIETKGGRELATLTFKAATLPALRTVLRKKLWAALEPVLEAASEQPAQDEPKPEESVPPKEPEREPEPKPEPESEPEPERAPEPEAEPEPEVRPDAVERPSQSKRRCDWVEIDVSGGTHSRWFDWNEEQRGALRGYKLQPVPQAGVGLLVFPFSHRRCGVASGLGFGLEHEQLLGVRSELAGRTLKTLGFASHGDLLLRFQLGPVRVEPRVGYAGQYFEIEDDLVPDAGYHGLRFGLELGLKWSFFLLEVAGGYRMPLLVGELASSSWFPEAKGFGYDASARIGFSAPDWFDVLGAAEFGEYSFALNASGAGAYPHGVASSAFDRYLRTSLLLRFHLR